MRTPPAFAAAGRMTGTLAPPGSRIDRLTAIDTLRGLAMILMALDHVRDFFGVPGISPTNLVQTDAALFFTRWVTHLCAPTFFLLTGTGAFLARRRRTIPGLSRFLATRGLWLVFLELTVIRCFGYQFNVDYQVTMLVVIWALGWAMVVLAALVWLPLSAIFVFGAVMIGGHNLLDGVRSTDPLWAVLHSPGFVINRPGLVVFAAYPLIPWIGVTAIGYALGQVYQWHPQRRRKFLLQAGLVLIAAFALLRGLNIYGDPSPWQPQSSGAMTLVSLLNATKYPPSLLFLLMTLGPALLILRALEGGTPRLLRPALTFGKVPFFYFVLHLTLIHVLAAILCYLRYGSAHWMFESPDLGAYPFTPPPDWGVSLPWVYLLWAAVVAMLYPLCARYAAVKQRQTTPWLSYL